MMSSLSDPITHFVICSSVFRSLVLEDGTLPEEGEYYQVLEEQYPKINAIPYEDAHEEYLLLKGNVK